MLLAPCPLQAMSRAEVRAFFDKALAALAQMRQAAPQRVKATA